MSKAPLLRRYIFPPMFEMLQASRMTKSDMKILSNIELDKKVSLELLKEVPVAIKSRLIQTFLKPSTEKTRSFFKKYRNKPKDVAITDFGTGHYFKVIRDTIEQYEDSSFDLCIDLGCGNTSLNKCALSQWNSYVGVDIYIDGLDSKNGRLNSIEHDLNKGLPEVEKVENYLIVAVNSFCYIENISALVESIESLPGKKTIIILDPNPSILWESAFNGFRIFLRNYKEIISTFKQDECQISVTPLTLGTPLLKSWVASNLIKINIIT